MWQRTLFCLFSAQRISKISHQFPFVCCAQTRKNSIGFVKKPVLASGGISPVIWRQIPPRSKGPMVWRTVSGRAREAFGKSNSLEWGIKLTNSLPSAFSEAAFVRQAI